MIPSSYRHEKILYRREETKIAEQIDISTLFYFIEMK
jgi:CCR4-NOT transcriptional regulation complex NOT5 subunit